MYLLLFRYLIYIILYIDINYSPYVTSAEEEIYFVKILANFTDLYYLNNFNEYYDMRILNASNYDYQNPTVFESSSESDSSNNNFNQDNTNNHNPIPDPNNSDDVYYFTEIDLDDYDFTDYPSDSDSTSDGDFSCEAADNAESDKIDYTSHDEGYDADIEDFDEEEAE